jgi:hypothetical protein
MTTRARKAKIERAMAALRIHIVLYYFIAYYVLSLLKRVDALNDPRIMDGAILLVVAASSGRLLRQTCRLYPATGMRIGLFLCAMGVLVFTTIQPIGLWAPATPTMRKLIVAHGLTLVARLLLDTGVAMRLLT